MPYLIATNQHRTQIARYENAVPDDKTIINITYPIETISNQEFKVHGELDEKLNEKLKQSRSVLSQNTALSPDEINDIIEENRKMGRAKIKAEVNDRMTQRITQHLNDNGIKTWEIQH